MDMDKKIKALENENLENKNKIKCLEVNNAKLEKTRLNYYYVTARLD